MKVQKFIVPFLWTWSFSFHITNSSFKMVFKFNEPKHQFVLLGYKNKRTLLFNFIYRNSNGRSDFKICCHNFYSFKTRNNDMLCLKLGKMMAVTSCSLYWRLSSLTLGGAFFLAKKKNRKRLLQKLYIKGPSRDRLEWVLLKNSFWQFLALDFFVFLKNWDMLFFLWKEIALLVLALSLIWNWTVIVPLLYTLITPSATRLIKTSRSMIFIKVTSKFHHIPYEGSIARFNLKT